MAIRTAAKQIRVPPEVRKATVAGPGYEEYKKYTQFIGKCCSVIDSRLKLMKKATSDFYAEGGTCEKKDGAVTIALRDTVYQVAYAPDGRVVHYSCDHPHGDTSDQLLIERLFYCLVLTPRYEQLLATFKAESADLENDVTIRGIAEIVDAIRQDKYLTMTAVSGAGIVSDQDADPFQMFNQEEQTDNDR